MAIKVEVIGRITEISEVDMSFPKYPKISINIEEDVAEYASVYTLEVSSPDLIDRVSYMTVGTKIKAFAEIKGNRWKKDPSKVFMSMKCWKIEEVGVSAPKSQPTQQYQPSLDSTQVATDDVEGDLLF